MNRKDFILENKVTVYFHNPETNEEIETIGYIEFTENGIEISLVGDNGKGKIFLENK